MIFPSRCQEVIEESGKLHNKPVADSPLTLAEVTGFMAMEVKLQSSLTEQNAKFIKVCLLCWSLKIYITQCFYLINLDCL